ncbi:MAG: preprotein translocase subunit SecD [Pseudonocardiales bacterium]|nr:preprotein translocase subunit SecD [Pseudonocardiales bacterium]
MAPPAGTLRVGRYFLALLAIFAVLYSIVFWPGTRHTPKLGLDLVGGQQVIFTAKTPNGGTPSKSAMSEAKQIMEERVNGSGVTEATVVIQGNNQIVISIPGGTNADVEALGKAAVLTMRGAVMPPVPVSCAGVTAAPSSGSSASSAPTNSSSPSGSTTPGAAGQSTPSGSAASVHGAAQRPLTAPTASSSATPKPTASGTSSSTAKSSTTPTPGATGSTSAAPAAKCTATPLAGLTFAIPTTETAYDKLSAADQQKLQAAVATVDCSKTSNQSDSAQYYVACDDGKTYGVQLAYLLGPVIVPGSQISGATASAPNVSSGQTQWTVQLKMKGGGQSAWAKYTGAHNLGGSSATSSSAPQCSSTGTPCADFVGFVLDGNVISAPVNQTVINQATTEITGNFTQSTANRLATQLKYGALPLSFEPQASQNVSATLGSSQLKAGLLAGGIGLALVVIYSLIYYRALGLVTIASLLVSGGLTYGCLVMLGTQIGFVLSLAGIAGFIVAVGITADSFVVFFERIKDEVHDGRSVRVAIPRAWVRARRTILSADTVSFLAAAILYYFAAGDVKGFAFTLGLSTVLDLVVVFLFTHPIVSYLSRKRAFAAARFTGLNSAREGGVALPAPETVRPRETRARAGAARSGRRGTEESPSSVAVLDDTSEEAPDDVTVTGEVTEDADHAVEPEAVVESEATDATDATDSTEVSADEPAPPPRRRTTPEPGSAAERAAARRAKLRAEKGDN